MLLRDPKGFIYAIQTETMSQVDLSDDHVILLLFAQGDWGKPLLCSFAYAYDQSWR